MSLPIWRSDVSVRAFPGVNAVAKGGAGSGTTMKKTKSDSKEGAGGDSPSQRTRRRRVRKPHDPVVAQRHGLARTSEACVMGRKTQ